MQRHTPGESGSGLGDPGAPQAVGTLLPWRQACKPVTLLACVFVSVSMLRSFELFTVLFILKCDVAAQLFAVSL